MSLTAKLHSHYKEVQSLYFHSSVLIQQISILLTTISFLVCFFSATYPSKPFSPNNVSRRLSSSTFLPQQHVTTLLSDPECHSRLSLRESSYPACRPRCCGLLPTNPPPSLSLRRCSSVSSVDAKHMYIKT